MAVRSADREQRSDKPVYRNPGHRPVVDALQARAKVAGAGIEWSDSTDIISGSAGIALFLLYAQEMLGANRVAELAARAGQRLIELGKPANGGLKWGISSRSTTLYPNFSHGAAGVGYTLARLHQTTGDKAFLDAALAAAKYHVAVRRSEPRLQRLPSRACW